MADTPMRIGPVALGAAPATVYTTPAATDMQLRNIHVANEGGSLQSFTLSVGADGSGTRLYKDVEIPANGAFDWSGYLPLAAGEILQAYADAPGVLTMTIGGVETTP